MKITVWKCEEDGRLFEFEPDYNTHMRHLRRERLYREKIEREEMLAAQWYEDHFFNAVKSPDQLIHAIKLHCEKLAMLKINEHYKKLKIVQPLKFYSLELSKVTYLDSVSNSHDRPRDGVTNWGGMVEGAPRGYPGFTGRIDHQIYWDKHNECHYPCCGDMFEPVCLHSGCGGGGGLHEVEDGYVQEYSYDFRIFTQDFPEMHRVIHEYKLMQTLKGEPVGKLYEQLNSMYPAEDYQPIVRDCK